MWKILMMQDLFHWNDMKHWELAPTNAAAFEKAGIPFCLTTADLRNVNSFLDQPAQSNGIWIKRSKAMEALTKTPATTIGYL